MSDSNRTFPDLRVDVAAKESLRRGVEESSARYIARTADALDELPSRSIVLVADGQVAYRKDPYAQQDHQLWYPAWETDRHQDQDFGVASWEMPTPCLILWRPPSAAVEAGER